MTFEEWWENQYVLPEAANFNMMKELAHAAWDAAWKAGYDAAVDDEYDLSMGRPIKP